MFYVMFNDVLCDVLRCLMMFYGFMMFYVSYVSFIVSA